jgi:hypothetical protein
MYMLPLAVAKIWEMLTCWMDCGAHLGLSVLATIVLGLSTGVGLVPFVNRLRRDPAKGISRRRYAANQI